MNVAELEALNDNELARKWKDYKSQHAKELQKTQEEHQEDQDINVRQRG